MSMYDEKVTWGGAVKVIGSVAVFALVLWTIGHAVLGWAFRHGILP